MFFLRITVALEKQDNETFGFEIQVSVTSCIETKLFVHRCLMLTPMMVMMMMLMLVPMDLLTSCASSRSADLRLAAEKRHGDRDVHVCA